MHRYCCRPVTSLTFLLNLVTISALSPSQLCHHLSLVTGRQQYRCTVPELYDKSKVLLKIGEFVARNM